jgi:hypothetical protein
MRRDKLNHLSPGIPGKNTQLSPVAGSIDGQMISSHKQSLNEKIALQQAELAKIKDAGNVIFEIDPKKIKRNDEIRENRNPRSFFISDKNKAIIVDFINMRRAGVDFTNEEIERVGSLGKFVELILGMDESRQNDYPISVAYEDDDSQKNCYIVSGDSRLRASLFLHENGFDDVVLRANTIPIAQALEMSITENMDRSDTSAWTKCCSAIKLINKHIATGLSSIEASDMVSKSKVSLSRDKLSRYRVIYTELGKDWMESLPALCVQASEDNLLLIARSIKKGVVTKEEIESIVSAIDNADSNIYGNPDSQRNFNGALKKQIVSLISLSNSKTKKASQQMVSFNIENEGVEYSIALSIDSSKGSIDGVSEKIKSPEFSSKIKDLIFGL